MTIPNFQKHCEDQNIQVPWLFTPICYFDIKNHCVIAEGSSEASSYSEENNIVSQPTSQKVSAMKSPMDLFFGLVDRVSLGSLGGNGW